MCVWHPHVFAALVLASALVAVAAAAAREPQQERQPRLDRHGDPLPEDALYRVGSSRFRIGRSVFLLTFSKDGKSLISLNETGFMHEAVVRCWDVASGKQLREFTLTGVGGSPLAPNGGITLSPDTTLLALVSDLRSGEAGSIRLVDTANGRVVRSFAKREHALGVAFTPDGRTLATADQKGTILLWDVASGASLGQWKSEQSGCISLVFSPNGKLAASVDRYSIVRLWDRATGQELHRLQSPERSKNSFIVAKLTFSLDGEIVAANFYDQIVFWNTRTGRIVRTIPSESIKSSSKVVFSPDGKLVAAKQNGFVCLWDASSGREIRKLGQRVDDCEQASPAFSPDGKLLAVGDENIHLWRVADGTEVWPRDSDGFEVASALFTPDGRFLLGGGTDGWVRLWDAAGGAEVRRFKARTPDYGSLAFSRDGKMLFGWQGHQFFLWDWVAGKERRRGTAPADADVFTLSPSTRMCAWSKDGFRHLCDTTTGKELYKWRGKVSHDYNLFFSPGEKLLIAADVITHESEMRDVTTGRQLPPLGSGEIMAVSPDDGMVARLDEYQCIHFHDMAKGREVAWSECGRALLPVPEIPTAVHAAVFSPDGQTLATVIERDPIRLWETATGKERYRLPQHQGYIEQLGFASDGSKLVSIGTEQNALVWRVFGPLPGQVAAELSAEQLRGLWTDLASEDGRVAFRAIRALTAADPTGVVNFLRRQGHDFPHLAGLPIARWIQELDSDEFTIREKATDELEKLGVLAEELLRKALQDRPTPEKRKRLEMVLDKLKDRPIPAARIVRGWRAVEVLEHLPAPEARKLLEEWARDIPQAQKALERLAHRPPTQL